MSEEMPIVSSLGTFFEGALTRVNYVLRYSGTPVLRPENVAEHSFQTAMIAATIAVDVGVDPAPVALRALLHDIEESLTGDVVRETKYFNDDVLNAMRQVERAQAESIFREWGPAGIRFKYIWERAKDDSDEGRIVKLADFLSVVIYTYRERMMGNGDPDIYMINKDVIENILLTFPEATLLGDYAREILAGIFPEKEEMLYGASDA